MNSCASVVEKEAPIQGSAEEEHLTNDFPEDGESEGQEACIVCKLSVGAEEDKIVQQSAGIVTESPAKDLANNARKKAVALNQISALQGHVQCQVFLGTAG